MTILGIDSDLVFTTLVDLISNLRLSSDLDHSMQLVTEAVMKLTPCEGASVRLLDENKTGFIAVARTGERVHFSPQAKLLATQGVLGWVASHAQPALIDDAHDDDRFEQREDQIRDIRSLLCIPLVGRGEVLGVVGITHTEPNRFTKTHLNVIELVSHCGFSYIEMARLRHLSRTDSLTQLHNRRHIDHRLEEELSRTNRYGHPLSLAMMDLDKFKPINDTHGHPTGDEVLRKVSETLKNGVRIHDILGRYGGDEFILIMPETPLSAAKTALERLLDMITRLSIQVPHAEDTEVQVGISFGLTECQPGDTPETFLKRADDALLKSKAHGGGEIFCLP